MGGCAWVCSGALCVVEGVWFSVDMCEWECMGVVWRTMGS